VLARVGLLDRATSLRHAARTLHRVILPAARDLLTSGAARRRFGRADAAALHSA